MNVTRATTGGVSLPGIHFILEKTSGMERLLRWCGKIASLFLFVMLVITFVDVFLRYFLGRPLDGTVELTSLLMSMIVLLYTAYAQWTKTHIIMDMLILKQTDENQHFLAVATYTWSAAIICIATFTMFQYGVGNTKTTAILGIPIAPVIYICSAGCALLFLTLCRDVLQSFADCAKSAGPFKLICAVLFAIIPIILAWYMVTHRMVGLNSITVGLVGMLLLFVLFFLGMPVAFALMTVGFIFVCILRGEGAGMTMISKTWYNTVSNYTWAPLMSFMFMGYACYYCGFGENLYRLGKAWMGHMRGGLAMGSVVACALFGAVVGDVLAGSIAMAAIALPEMRSAKYDDKLAVGTLACSGTIGALIPPSTTFILYGVLAEQSISELFIAGLLPGVLCTVLFMLAIYIQVSRKPELAPRLPKASQEERRASLKGGLPVVMLFVLVIGGIYGGLFTATEGGAIGACGTLLLGLFMGRLKWKNFKSTLEESNRFTAMCFTLLGGANVLGYFMTMSRIPTWLATSIAAMDVAPLLVLVVIILVICFLGCFLPAIPLILICVPIFVPIAKVFGWDLIWFGVIIAVLNNMASITPPFGISLFVMKGIADIPLLSMFRAAVPFILALFACLAILIAFPQISTFLPELLKQ